MSAPTQSARLDATGDVPSAPAGTQVRRAQRRHVVALARPGDDRPAVPLSELVLVDQHEAQGWRVRQDERLDRLFEERCDWVRTYGRAGQLAVDAGDVTYTYDEIDARANQLARYLRLHGASAGDRIGLLFDRPADAYVAVLGVLKIGAAYVPLDVTTPARRLAAVVDDAHVRSVLSTTSATERVDRVDQLTGIGVEVIDLDRAARLIDEQDGRRLMDAERGIRDADLAYISYPPAADGPLAGVAVDHRSICNFVKVAAEMYGVRPWDRVYQGMPVALDSSVEEIWVPWASGATLVPRPAGPSPAGRELHEFLTSHHVTALWCVPRVLASLEEDLPDLRLVLVAGEACPEELVTRWHRPGRRLLGVYGPAEATVSAMLAELHPDRPVTIGVPLPTYSTVVLDVDDPFRALPHGGTGEIGIAGIGLACGYLNRADLTAKAFIPDFLGIPANPSGRIYRTGDLGRVTPDGEVERLGRVAQRGPQRCDRTETEGLGTVVPGVTPVGDLVADPVPLVEPVVDLDLDVPAPTAVLAVDVEDLVAAPLPVVEPVALPPAAPAAPVTPEPLAAAPSAAALGFAAVLAEVLGVESVPLDTDVFDDLGADSMLMARFCAKVRKRDDLLTVSMRDVYQNRTVARLALALAPAPAPVAMPGPVAEQFAALLAEVLGVESVPLEAHVFDDLGADSMLMARFCAKVRKRDDLPTVSMRDVYAHPTAVGLAAVFTPAGSTGTPVATAESSDPPMITTSFARIARAVRGARHSRTSAGTPRYVLCAALQLVCFLAYSSLGGVVVFAGFHWISAGAGPLDVYLRSVLLVGGSFVVLSAVPIVAKWALVGRWKPRQIAVWSMAYLRFWIVKTLVQRSPMALFVGSPLYVLYLRALGAKIGPGVAIFSRNVPVCTDLLTIGEGAVIRKNAFFTCYRAHDGLIQTAPVTLGRNVLVGEKAVLDVGTTLGDGAQLGHTSALHSGQSVPAGERWHGSPAQPTEVDYRTLDEQSAGTLRRTVFSVVQLLNATVLFAPLVVVAMTLLFTRVPVTGVLFGSTAPVFTSWTFFGEALLASAVLFFGSTLVGLVVTFTVPRVLNLALTPGKVYPLYGVHYWLHRLIVRLTNRKFFTELFGDSSFIVGYLRGLGYELTPVVQTGSNFGMAVQQDNPFLSSVGSGTVVADGLSIVNADFSSTSFRVSQVSIGRNNFLGNHIAYPAQGRTGDDCLLATKVLVPIEGEVREGVGLLGSPSFEIPRSVERDNSLDIADPDELKRLLAAKDRHNAVSIVLRLLVRWGHFFGVILLVSATDDLLQSFGALAVAPVSALVLLWTVAYYVLVERAVDRMQTLAPRGCSIYDEAFWRHERSWKIPSESYFTLFDGTPFKNVLWRLLGVRIGRRVFDDGCFLTERSFTAIGDGCTLNTGSVIQCHSQEDGAFKSDRTTLGAGCTLGTASFVHYGVTMGDGAVLAADSFLMKGEEVPPQARWGGNPARRMRENSADHQIRHVRIDDAGAMLVRSA